MAIVVTPEPDPTPNVMEVCVFCRTPTRYWYTPSDVACCQNCAKEANPEDVPTKEQWCRRERIVEKARKHMFFVSSPKGVRH